MSSTPFPLRTGSTITTTRKTCGSCVSVLMNYAGSILCPSLNTQAGRKSPMPSTKRKRRGDPHGTTWCVWRLTKPSQNRSRSKTLTGRWRRWATAWALTPTANTGRSSEKDGKDPSGSISSERIIPTRGFWSVLRKIPMRSNSLALPSRRSRSRSIGWKALWRTQRKSAACVGYISITATSSVSCRRTGNRIMHGFTICSKTIWWRWKPSQTKQGCSAATTLTRRGSFCHIKALWNPR